MTTPIVHQEFNGLRITPSVYTTPAEIDTFSARMEDVLKKGLPRSPLPGNREPAPPSGVPFCRRDQ